MVTELSVKLHAAGLLDMAEDGIVTIDQFQKIVLFNHGAEKLFGYSRAELLGKPLEVLLPPRYAATHYGQVEGFAKGDMVSRTMGERDEVYGRRKDGSDFPADVSISKLTVDGKIYLTAIVRDVTERVRAQEAILKLNSELEQRVADRTAALTEVNRKLMRTSEENETFVYSVSHDLRSPLVNIQGFSQELRRATTELRRLLADYDVPDQIRDRAARLIDQDMAESLGYIEAGVARLSKIIDALLRLSRAGRVEYNLARVDLNEVLSRIVNALRATIAEKQAEVVVRELPSAWGDPVAVEQVFANLIGNALNYLSPERRGRVEVGFIGENEDGRTYFVKDNGLGIPASYLPQLFHAFRRLHPEVAGGEGMGLAIVRRVIERHSGRVWAESEAKKGTTFFVTLPEPGTNDRGTA